MKKYNKKFKFTNGYGACVSCNVYSDGGMEGLFEVHILDHEDEIVCETNLSDDGTIGRLSFSGVAKTLEKIKKFPNKAL